MKALILTCSTGEGHNSVAAAVQDVFLTHGAQCDIEDALSFLSKRASDLICRWHARMYRYAPGAWRVGYRFLEHRPTAREERNLVIRILSLGAERLHERVAAEGYELLICPHVFAGLMVTKMRRLYPDEGVRACFIATDYTCSPFVANCGMDRFFVPAEQTVPEFTAAGIPAERIRVTGGVPVRRAFYERVEKTEARRRMGLPETGRMLLVMCGSMGCGHLDDLAGSMSGRLPEGTFSVVVCGTNEHMYKKLERIYEGRDDIYVLGYCDDMPLVMDCADLYLTKPGGISVSEAAVKRLPMVLLDAVAGCEEPNLRFFGAMGCAVAEEKPEAAAAACLRLLADGGALARMGAAFPHWGYAAEEIWEQLTEREEARQ